MRMGESLINASSSEGFLARDYGAEQTYFVGQDGQFNTLNSEGLCRLKGYQFSNQWDLKKLWTSTPAPVYKKISIMLEESCRRWKISLAKHKAQIPCVSENEDHMDYLLRPDLTRGL